MTVVGKVEFQTREVRRCGKLVNCGWSCVRSVRCSFKCVKKREWYPADEALICKAGRACSVLKSTRRRQLIPKSGASTFPTFMSNSEAFPFLGLVEHLNGAQTLVHPRMDGPLSLQVFQARDFLTFPEHFGSQEWRAGHCRTRYEGATRAMSGMSLTSILSVRGEGQVYKGEGHGDERNSGGCIASHSRTDKVQWSTITQNAICSQLRIWLQRRGSTRVFFILGDFTGSQRSKNLFCCGDQFAIRTKEVI